MRKITQASIKIQELQNVSESEKNDFFSFVAKNNQIGALLNFLRAFLDDQFQLESLSGRYILGLCPVVLQMTGSAIEI